jgi:hypothetical protein
MAAMTATVWSRNAACPWPMVQMPPKRKESTRGTSCQSAHRAPNDFSPISSCSKCLPGNREALSYQTEWSVQCHSHLCCL